MPMTAAVAHDQWHDTIRRRVEAAEDTPELYEATVRAYVRFKQAQLDEWAAEEATMQAFGLCVG